MSTKPKVFYWWDAVTFGGLAALLSLASVIGWLRPENHWQPLLAGTVVALGAWGIYGILLRRRWQYVSSIAFTTVQGVSVIPAGFICPRADFEDDMANLIHLWMTNAPEYASKILSALDGVVVTFKPLPFEIHGRPGKLAGLTYPRSKQSLVGYKMPLKSSALDHELGHIIYGNATGNWDEGAYHTFAKERHLP